MKFSVAIPAYKRKFLYSCIDSIIKQDYSDFELIIVNDNSPEDLETIIKLFDDHRIKYFKNEKNCGAEHVVDNWNICLSYASGDYFILMGDDDEMTTDYLSTFFNLIKSYPDQNVYHCRSFIIDDKSEVKRLSPSWPEWESVYENIWHRMNNLREQFISDFVYKKKFLDDNNGFYKLPLAWASDDITSFQAAGKNGIIHTQKPVFCYRESDISISNSESADLKLQAIDEEEKWYKNFIGSSIPINKIDTYFYNCIKKEQSNFFLTKRIETIAYNGIREKNFFRDCIYFLRKRKLFKLNLQHIFYAIILAVKKSRSKTV
jgi:glycosyltransferase involved in cell wall biosynthesis